MAEPDVQPEELSLVAALRDGDESAFLEVVRRYHSSMLRLAHIFVPVAAVAEEVVQETWVAVLEGISRFEGRSSLRCWIFRIVANRARTRAQREARTEPFSAYGEEEDAAAVDESRFHPADHPRWPGHWAAPPSAWADEQLLTRETLKLAREAIDKLPARQKQVIVLRDVEGCSAEEVCLALEISDANQRVLLHRARGKVRAELEAQLGPR